MKKPFNHKSLPLNTTLHGCALSGLRQLPDECIDTCVTSPPYWGLRDYGKGTETNFGDGWTGKLGLEPTPEMFVDHLVEIFTEVKRVLKKTGTLWLNLGDSYAATGKNRTEKQAVSKSTLAGGKQNQTQVLKQQSKVIGGLKTKDLIGIPWMVAFALRSAGWFLRMDIIWHKPNPMPESVTDRPTKAHEYIFLLSKSKKYYYDAEAIKVDGKNPEDDIRRISKATKVGKSTPTSERNGIRNSNKVAKRDSFKRTGSKRGNPLQPGQNYGTHREDREETQPTGKANKRSVWTVATRPFKEAHFATFPPQLIEDCIKAGCPVGGIVLDPFMGARTTGITARKLGCNYIGMEINADYIAIGDKREYQELGLFAPSSLTATP